MKLEYNVFPDFYKQYDWAAETEEDKLFTGREYYLKNFWRNLCNVANRNYSRQNRTFIGQRKLGKTAFLVHCYNLAFWEQDEVIPFYYCFPQTEKLNLRKTANDIAFKFFRQVVGFITKNKELLTIQSSRLLLSKLKKLNFSWLDDFEIYWQECQEQIKATSSQLTLGVVWNLVTCFSSLFDKKCVVIIDEYQKTVRNLLDENGESVACHESIAEIVNNRDIFTIISGSQTSMLAYEALTSELHNRIPGEKFDPLPEKEAHQLILEYVGKEGYEGIGHDVYRLVGGNPYYIKMLFTPTNKFYRYFNRDKSWKSKEEIEELYNFEMLHIEGEVFQFWRKHINEKHHLLNNDPLEHKGITLCLLKYIAEQCKEVHIEELKEKFPEITDMRERLTKLRETDLIMDSVDSEEITNFSDHVLPVVMTKMHQKIILGTISKAAFRDYQEKWFKTLEERITERYEESEKRVKNIESSVDSLKKEVKTIHKENKELQARITKITAKVQTAKRSAQGKANLEKGTKAQSKAAKAVETVFKEKKTIFSNNYELKEPLLDINVKLASGSGNEVDFYGVLESRNGVKPKEYALIGEVKHNKKRKVSEAAVDKFIDSVGVVKRDSKKQKSICMFISNTGFAKEAISILERNQVIYGNLKEVIEKISLQ